MSTLAGRLSEQDGGALASGGPPERRVRLLIVTPWPLAASGGAQRLAQNLASSLATDFGLEVIVAAGSGAAGTPSVQARSTPIREVRLSLTFRPSERQGWIRRYHGLRTDASLEGLEALGKDVRPRAVLYVSHYSSCAEQAAALANRLAVPFVLVPAIHLDHPQHTSRRARQFYRSTSLVLCLSAIEREWLINRAGLPPGQVLALGYGWDGPVVGRVPLPRPSRSVRLLTVSAYVRHKRIEHQLEAVAILRRSRAVDASLTIAGALREPVTLSRLRRLARQRMIEDAVRFLPDCEDSTIAALHETSNLFLFTSGSESYGVAVLEAIGFGTPPVVYPHPVYRSLVEESGFGSVATRSTPRALADAVVAALDAPAAAGEETRLRWLAARTWSHLVTPFAQWCASLEGA